MAGPYPTSPPRGADWTREAVRSSWRDEQALTWTPFGAGRAALWTSGVFDLRPDLGREGYGRVPAIAIDRSAVFGAGVYLYVQVRNIARFPASTEALLIHWTHPFLAEQIAASTIDAALTMQLLQGGTDALFPIEPPGDTIRFWQVRIRFQHFDGAGADPTPAVSVHAACY